MKNHYIKDMYPKKAQFATGEDIKLVIELENTSDAAIELQIILVTRFLNRTVKNYKYDIGILLPGAKKELPMLIDPIEEDFCGYGADVYAYGSGKLMDTFSSAFDVVSDWRRTARYGFLSDFYAEDSGDKSDVESLCKLHMNFVQFYDWMYRSDELVAPSDDFTDLMGRRLNQKVVREKVNYCHEYGMKAIAYGAVYASSFDFFIKHVDWALYDSNGNALSFIDRFYIMNISMDSPWHWHIISQYKNAVEAMDFDGIHMDTYGFPKTAISKLDGAEKIVRLKEHFPLLINNTRRQLEKVKDDICLIFNNVGNWPVDSVADARQDAVYIEVWKPYERYFHLQQIISRARCLGNKKPVILAAYNRSFIENTGEEAVKAETSTLILSAVIAANGAYHLLLGEKNGILTQGYYVDYYKANDYFMRIIRNYYDFNVRYENILYDSCMEEVSMTHADGDNMEYVFENFRYSTYGETGKVWVIIRESPAFKTVSFINLTGCRDDFWCSGKDAAVIVKDLIVSMQIACDVKSVFLSSPDFDMGRPQLLEYRIESGNRGKKIVLTVPKLNIWDLLVVEMEL